jgi:DNA-binding CsgD family transcriptional regulator
VQHEGSYIEPLSPRELEVLQLMAQGLDFHKLAAALQVSYSTARTHSVKIYAKLQVTSRSEAIVKANMLGLVRIGGLSPVAFAIAQLLVVQPGALDELRRAGVIRG